jgi:hypothetical protein
MIKTRRFFKLMLTVSPWIGYNPALLGRLHNDAKEGSMSSIAFESKFGNHPFEKISKTFLDDPTLPFAAVLSKETIELVFRKYDGLFGGTFYNTVFVLWAFLLQTLSDGKSRSCSTAVGRIAAFCLAIGKRAPDEDTGDYCKARAKLSLNALHELVTLVAKNTETAAPEKWLWKNKYHAKLVDGFTATMPDTPKNQARFPQTKKSYPGCGFPIMRVCVVLSLATAMVMDAAFSEYAGKETGESALLRKLLSAFNPGDIAVFDRYCCSYMMLALFHQGSIHVCARIPANRLVDFRKGKRLGKDDCLVSWNRPIRPKWMSEEVYATIPPTMTLRMMRYSLAARGRRSQSITVVTTLTDAVEYEAEEIAQLYAHRWNVELDIRHIKQTLNIDHFRCKSPAMVERELWVTLLGYNLVRKVMCEAAHFAGVLPRRLSFTRTCAHLLDLRLWLMIELLDLSGLLRYLGSLVVPLRSGRFEPRVLKRSRHRYPMMKIPRQKLKQIEMRKLL